MKKIITIILIAIIVIPLFPGKNVEASTTKDQSTPGKVNGLKQKAIFYAVSEKSGMQFSGANGGANNFFDALRQTNYELYKNDNTKLTKNGEKPVDRINKVIDEIKDKKPTPKPGSPGVGTMLITGYAFSVVHDMILNAWEEFAYGLASDHNLQGMYDLIATTDGKPITEIPGFMTFEKTQRMYEGNPRMWFTVIRTSEGKTIRDAMNGYWKPGTESITAYRKADSVSWNKVPLVNFEVIERGVDYKELGQVEKYNSKDFSFIKSEFDSKNFVIKEMEPKSLGTLTNPSWDTGSETDLPGFVELEVPITEDGEIDLDRQLSPDNPARNDPKKPLGPAPVETPDDYTVPDKEDGKKPVPAPNLTPKPDPNTNPLPSPSPLPEPSPAPDPTVPPAEDTPTTKPGDTQNRWAALVTNKFPFSLPWDIGNMIAPLLADPVRPSVKVNESFDVFGQSVPIKFSHNFAWMDDFIGFVRIFILIGFNLFMITGTRKLMGGGQ